jgi:multiple sugar transport system substrate-binding protein
MNKNAHFGFTVAAITASVMVGCAAPTPVSQSGKIQVLISSDAFELAAYKSLVDQFTKIYPTVEVELSNIPSSSDFRRQLGVQLAGGTPPDVFLINYRRIGLFAAKEHISPTGDYLAQSASIKEADFYEPAINAFKWNGKLACMPQNISSLVVFYNKTLFASAGVPAPANDWTWDDFERAAKAITKDTNGDGTPDIWGVGTEVSMFRLAPLIWAAGGELVDNQTQPTKLLLDTPAGMTALNWFTSWQTQWKAAPNRVAEKAMDSETRFQRGQMGMFLSSRRAVTALRQIEVLDWDVAPMPRKIKSATMLHSDGWCISAASKQRTLAWAFVEFVNGNDGQKLLSGAGRTVPSRQSIAQSSAFLDTAQKPTRASVFLDAISHIRAVPTVTSWVDVEDNATKLIDQAFYGEISPEQAARDASAQSVALFSAAVTK